MPFRTFPAFLLVAVVLLALFTATAFAEDQLVKTNGSKYTGRFLEERGEVIYFEVHMGTRKYRMRFQKGDVAAMTVNGETRTVSGGAPAKESGKAPATQPPVDIAAATAAASKDLPKWWNSSPLTAAQQLAKDRYGPAIAEGASADDKAALAEAFYALGDWKRAALWWLQAPKRGTADDPYALAWCLIRIGAKREAQKVLPDTDRDDADFSLLKVAIAAEHGTLVRKLIGNMVRGSDHRAWQQLGDRLANEGTWLASAYCYEQVHKPKGKGNAGWDGHIRQARKSLVALYRDKAPVDLDRVPDGAYRGACRGFVNQVGVLVSVKGHRIADVKVIQSRENRPKPPKSNLNALVDVPKRIEQKNGLKGVDTVSGATISSNAVIAAVGEALKRAETPADPGRSKASPDATQRTGPKVTPMPADAPSQPADEGGGGGNVVHF